MTDPTFTEALDHLAGSLPANPELDTEHQRALRVVVGEVRQLLMIIQPLTAEEVDALKVAWESARRQALTTQEGE